MLEFMAPLPQRTAVAVIPLPCCLPSTPLPLELCPGQQGRAAAGAGGVGGDQRRRDLAGTMGGWGAAPL